MHPVGSSRQNPSELLQLYCGRCIPVAGRSRSLQQGQSQRRQPGTCSLRDPRSGALPQDRKTPVASQRGTWVGTARSQSCRRYPMGEGQVHQPAHPAFTVALPVAVRTAHPANTRQSFLLSSCFVFCMCFEVAAPLKGSLQEPLCTHHRFPLLPWCHCNKFKYQAA